MSETFLSDEEFEAQLRADREIRDREFEERFGHRPEETPGYADFQRGVDDFDAEYFRLFGRYPEESPLYGTTPRANDHRRQAILNLVERGATEGERDAARAALARMDEQDEEDYMDALHHGEA